MPDNNQPNKDKDDNNDKSNPILDWLSESKHLLAALAALATAITALLKPQDHTVTKNSYEATSAGIVKLEEELKQDHEDIVALRGYIDGVLHQPIVVSPSTPSSSKISTGPSSAGNMIMKKRPHVIVLSPSGDVTSAVAESPSALPSPPPIHIPPSPWKAPTFNDIESKK